MPPAPWLKVVCGDVTGDLFVATGRVHRNGQEYTPTEFERLGGKSAAKKWKQSIRLLELDQQGNPCPNTTCLGDWLLQQGLEIRANMLSVVTGPGVFSASLANPPFHQQLQLPAFSQPTPGEQPPSIFTHADVQAVALAAAAAAAAGPNRPMGGSDAWLLPQGSKQGQQRPQEEVLVAMQAYLEGAPIPHSPRALEKLGKEVAELRVCGCPVNLRRLYLAVREGGGYQAVQRNQAWAQVAPLCVQQPTLEHSRLGSEPSSSDAVPTKNANTKNKQPEHSNNNKSSSSCCSNKDTNTEGGRHLNAHPGSRSADGGGLGVDVDLVMGNQHAGQLAQQASSTSISMDNSSTPLQHTDAGRAQAVPPAKVPTHGSAAVALGTGVRVAYERFLLRLERKEALLLQCGLNGIAVAAAVSQQPQQPQQQQGVPAVQGTPAAPAAGLPADVPLQRDSSGMEIEQASPPVTMHSNSSSGPSLSELLPGQPPLAAPPLMSCFMHHPPGSSSTQQQSQQGRQQQQHLQPFSVRRTQSGPKGGRRKSAAGRQGGSSSPPASGAAAEDAAEGVAREAAALSLGSRGTSGELWGGLPGRLSGGMRGSIDGGSSGDTIAGGGAQDAVRAPKRSWNELSGGGMSADRGGDRPRGGGQGAEDRREGDVLAGDLKRGPLAAQRLPAQGLLQQQGRKVTEDGGPWLGSRHPRRTLSLNAAPSEQGDACLHRLSNMVGHRSGGNLPSVPAGLPLQLQAHLEFQPLSFSSLPQAALQQQPQDSMGMQLPLSSPMNPMAALQGVYSPAASSGAQGMRRPDLSEMEHCFNKLLSGQGSDLVPDSALLETCLGPASGGGGTSSSSNSAQMPLQNWLPLATAAAAGGAEGWSHAGGNSLHHNADARPAEASSGAGLSVTGFVQPGTAAATAAAAAAGGAGVACAASGLLPLGLPSTCLPLEHTCPSSSVPPALTAYSSGLETPPVHGHAAGVPAPWLQAVPGDGLPCFESCAKAGNAPYEDQDFQELLRALQSGDEGH